MGIEEQLIQDFLALPEEKKREVIDFVEFLKNKSNKELENAMNEVINENREALEELSKFSIRKLSEEEQFRIRLPVNIKVFTKRGRLDKH